MYFQLQRKTAPNVLVKYNGVFPSGNVSAALRFADWFKAKLISSRVFIKQTIQRQEAFLNVTQYIKANGLTYKEADIIMY